MARAIDADELLAFLYSESAGTDEQLSDWIEECGLSDAEVIDRAKKLCWTVIEGFINVIKTAPTLTLPNEPLTMEELWKMDGEPVYMTFPSDTGNQCGHWALVGTQRWGAVSLIYGCGWSSYESAVETLGAKFYRRPPEGEEHCYG
jgi:hypothetical protein